MAKKQAAPRVVLIVGANRGIGYHLVKRLLELGDFVSALDIETDITVLETMLRREGLSGSDFSVGTKRKEN